MNLVGDLGSEETKVRIELKRDDGKAELAYLDAWHLADGEWQSLGCQWGVGSPILGYAPILDIDPSIYDRLGPETLPVLELAPLRPLERLRW